MALLAIDDSIGAEVGGFLVSPSIEDAPTPSLLRVQWSDEAEPVVIGSHLQLLGVAESASPNATAAADSISRGFSDLHFGRFVLSIGALSAARTLLQQPISIALTRKQACSRSAGMPTVSIVRQIYRAEGGLFRGLGRGAPALVAAQMATDVITLGVFEYARERLSHSGGGDTVAMFCGGYLGDAICQAFRIPLLVVATRQMLDTTKFPESAVRTGATVIRQGGIRSLYAGLGTTLVIGSQWTGLWWLLYAKLKAALYYQYHSALGISQADSPEVRLAKTNAIIQRSRWMRADWGVFNPNDNVVLNSAASVVTSAFTAMLFNPYLVIRTRLQAQSGSTILGVAKQVFRESGVRGFWHGTVLNINACVFDAWLASTTYEWAKIYSDKSRDRQPGA